MTAARLAEPGERFVLIGALPEHPVSNGATGTALYLLTENDPAYWVHLEEIKKWGAMMVVEFDRLPYPTRKTRWGAPRCMLFAIDGDPDAIDSETDEPIRDEVIA